MARPYVFTEPAARKLVTAARLVLGAPIDQRGQSARIPAVTPGEFWAKIGTSAGISGATNRWQYAWTEQRLTATGWEYKPDGLTGTTDTDFALNSMEANNSGSGVQGNSIDHDTNYPSGFEIRPIRGSPVVWMRIMFYKDDDGDMQRTYRFQATNAEQGPCS